MRAVTLTSIANANLRRHNGQLETDLRTANHGLTRMGVNLSTTSSIAGRGHQVPRSESVPVLVAGDRGTAVHTAAHFGLL